jgi:hypothetical protein
LEITKIRLSELESFVQSETYRQFTTIPITVLRAKSYVNNPHAKPGDIVLYLGFVEKQLVAFRSLFADRISFKEEPIRFAWCSGNWVHPDFRRKGFSEKLLMEAFTDWNGKLMFTNYAPDSEKLYLKSGKFLPIHQFQGFRGYLFPKTRKLIQGTNKNGVIKFVFSVVDIIISIFSEVKLWFFSTTPNPDISFETLCFPDEECYQILHDNPSKPFFKRGEAELKWIFQFPWISENKKFSLEKYPFSSFSNSFLYHIIKVYIKNRLAGFFIFSVREGYLKTLFFSLPEGIEKEVANYLKQFSAKNKIEIVTVYKYEIAQQLFTRKFPFLRTKKYGQKIYSSFEIDNKTDYQFQDGDGDVIFT